MNNFLIVSQQIGIIVIFILMGVLALKTNIFKEDMLNYLAKFVINIAMPLTIFVGIVNKTTAEDLYNSLPILVVSFVIEAGLFVCAWLIARWLKLKGDHKNLFCAMTTFGNCIFIGLPLITALFPGKGLLYISLYTIVDQILVWTLAVKLTTHVEEKTVAISSANGKNIASEGKTTDAVERAGAVEGVSEGVAVDVVERIAFMTKMKQFVKNITSPALVGIVVGVVFVLLGVRLPEIINKPLTDMGNVTTPISMLYLGAFLCSIDFKKAFSRVEYYVVCLIKLLVFPVALFTVLTLINFDAEAAFALSLMAGHPTMTSMVMFANLRGSDGEYACGGLFLTTAFSIVTIPVLSLIFEQIAQWL